MNDSLAFLRNSVTFSPIAISAIVLLSTFASRARLSTMYAHRVDPVPHKVRADFNLPRSSAQLGIVGFKSHGTTAESCALAAFVDNHVLAPVSTEAWSERCSPSIHATVL